MISEPEILEALKDIQDPEIPVNIVDLGLVYNVEIDKTEVKITMTLTSPGCPMTEQIMGDVQGRLRALEEVENAEVDFVFDPPWNPEMMSDAAKRQLGFK